MEIIGEAAVGVSLEFKEKYPQIRWRNIIGMRNRLIHGYYDINKNIVWKTIKEDIPPLSADLENILEYEEQLKEAILKNNLYKELSLYGLDGDLILYYQVKQDINKVGRYKIFITEIATPTS